MIRVYGDLGNLDPKGRAVLYANEVFGAERESLRAGVRVLVWDGEMEAEGTLEYDEDHWRARIDWTTAIDKETGERLPERYWK